MKRPNVILISIDTLRADHLSCYGYHKKTTPNLDRLAVDGVLYENAYSTASWTPPAHASMLTGLYPSFHGAVDNNRLGKNIPTLAEILLENGYKTAGFVNNSQVGELVGLEKGHETFIEVWKGTGGMPIAMRGINFLIRNLKELIGINDHGADMTNRFAQTWLRENKRNPFYIFIHYIEPHNPINAPYPFKNKYWDDRNNRKTDKKKLYLVAHNPLICFTDNIRLNDEEITALKALYDGEISYVDHKIGEFLDYLKKEGIYDNTLIIITADHGEHFGEHGLYSHVASLYEPILHVPLIIRYPEGLKKQSRISGLAQLIDIYPTVVETIGLDHKYLEGIQGKSLFGVGCTERYHDYIIAEWEGRVPDFIQTQIRIKKANVDLTFFTTPLKMIRKGNYKLIVNPIREEELYDLNYDVHELKNLANDNPWIISDLKKKLHQWESSIVPKTDCNESRELTDEIKKNLEALGYM